MTRIGVEGAHVIPVPDGDYREVASRLITSAYRRCLCSLFIVDPSPVNDPDLLVNALIELLARATWRGSDVRLLIGGSRSNIAIAEASYASLAVAKEHGISARWITRGPIRGSHTKLVVGDDRLLVGSHNWSGGALGGLQRQDSLLITSADLAEYCSSLFEEQWNRSGDE